MNFMEGQLADADKQFAVGPWIVPVDVAQARMLASFPGRPVTLGIRPEHVIVDGPGHGDGRLEMEVVLVEPLGGGSSCDLSARGLADNSKDRKGESGGGPGQAVKLRFAMEQAHWFELCYGAGLMAEGRRAGRTKLALPARERREVAAKSGTGSHFFYFWRLAKNGWPSVAGERLNQRTKMSEHERHRPAADRGSDAPREEHLQGDHLRGHRGGRAAGHREALRQRRGHRRHHRPRLRRDPRPARARRSSTRSCSAASPPRAPSR